MISQVVVLTISYLKDMKYDTLSTQNTYNYKYENYYADNTNFVYESFEQFLSGS